MHGRYTINCTILVDFGRKTGIGVLMDAYVSSWCSRAKYFLFTLNVWFLFFFLYSSDFSVYISFIRPANWFYCQGVTICRPNVILLHNVYGMGLRRVSQKRFSEKVDYVIVQTFLLRQIRGVWRISHRKPFQLKVKYCIFWLLMREIVIISASHKDIN